jgi:hypothetical protein
VAKFDNFVVVSVEVSVVPHSACGDMVLAAGTLISKLFRINQNARKTLWRW